MTKTTAFTGSQANKVTVKLQIWSGPKSPDKKNTCHLFCDNLQNPLKSTHSMGHFHLTLNIQPYSISLFLEHLVPSQTILLHPECLLLPSPAWLHSAYPSVPKISFLQEVLPLDLQSRLALHSTFLKNIYLAAPSLSCGMQIWFPDQGLNPDPPYTGPPGKSPALAFIM